MDSSRWREQRTGGPELGGHINAIRVAQIAFHMVRRGVVGWGRLGLLGLNVIDILRAIWGFVVREPRRRWELSFMRREPPPHCLRNLLQPPHETANEPAFSVQSGLVIKCRAIDRHS